MDIFRKGQRDSFMENRVSVVSIIVKELRQMSKATLSAGYVPPTPSTQNITAKSTASSAASLQKTKPHIEKMQGTPAGSGSSPSRPAHGSRIFSRQGTRPVSGSGPDCGGGMP